LHTDQHDHAGAGVFDQRRQALGTDAGVDLVEGMDVEVDIVAEDAALGAILGEAVQRGQRVRRHRRAHPLDDIAVLVVMRRLDQQEAKTPPCPALRAANAPITTRRPRLRHAKPADTHTMRYSTSETVIVG
jgi:hypothetical protein